MLRRGPVALACLGLILGVVIVAHSLASRRGDAPDPAWVEVSPGILRSTGIPAAHALCDGDTALLLDAPQGTDLKALQRRGIRKIDLVLLTHHHRDTTGLVPELLKAGVPVRAPKASAEWLLAESVARYWQESLPLRNSRTAYLVAPVGFKDVRCDLEDGQEVLWRGWRLSVVATPGHSRDHVAFAARRASECTRASAPIVFCGDAFVSPGKLWSPYTTDWDHWTDAGLKPAADSLRKLAELNAALLCPAHGQPIAKDCADVLKRTADAVAEVGFLKSFERFTKERLGNAPQYAFLAKEQAETSGEKPWSQISPHLFLTGNTYVLVSKDNQLMVFDPWGKRSVDQVLKLQADRKLGEIALVMFSHAHFDHYDGVYDLPGREKYHVWSLDLVAAPLAEPMYYRAPFLDPRPVKFDRRLRDGETATWREYTFRFHHFPGQTYFTMAVDTEIDGKKCLFTADNFFHQDQFSGTGGWMGLNRSWPLPYAASARKVLEIRPERVLAEHGGAFAFDAEDFRRRLAWGEAAAKAADAVSPSGNHRLDWNPHRVHVEPLVHRARPGAQLSFALCVENPLVVAERLRVTLDGREVLTDPSWDVEAAPRREWRRNISLKLPDDLPPGRHVFGLRVEKEGAGDPSDAFIVIDAER
jgi:glyoxylase-like metal-dependent hydrolase (beta-lactamase superfamily II)